MDRRQFIKAVGFGTVGIAFQVCVESLKISSVSKPNLVIVFPDQMRVHAMGFMNQDPVYTPVLDRFAKESLVLTQAVSNYPVCSPFRAMLMTGKYPFSNKVTNNCLNITEPLGCELQQSDRCFSDVLKDKGYSLSYIGKWHLEAPRAPYVDCENNKGEEKWNEWCPPDRRHGFDFWYSYNTYDYHNRPLYWSTDAGRNEFHYVDQWGPEHEADLAIKYINNQDGKYRDPNKPFALVVSMNPPHTPYHLVPDKYKKPYADMTDDELINRKNVKPGSPGEKTARKSLRNYFAMCTGVDRQFGRILEGLKDAGLENDTIVLFTSDHGNCLGSHNHDTKNVHWEESMRIPLLIRFPGRIQPRSDDLLISVPDIYPTLLDLMGFKNDIPAEVQGVSHAKLLTNGSGFRPDAQLYMWVPKGKPSYGRRGVRTSRFTMMTQKMPDKPIKAFLYDNVSDPYQLKNIAEESPDVIKELTAKLNVILKKLDDPWLSS
ncbi:MAG: sulfatase family protein [Planctomycetota bacterium]|jgi:arylsulfatase A-like enzyme